MEPQHLSDEDKYKVTLQVDHFIEILSDRYGIEPNEVIDAVKWVRQRKKFSEAVQNATTISFLGVLISASPVRAMAGGRSLPRCVQKVTMTTRDELRQALAHPNVRAFLRLVREGESSQDDSAYSVMYGGGHFASFGDHPRHKVDAHGIVSTAAGAYQFLQKTWDELVALYGFEDLLARLPGRGRRGAHRSPPLARLLRVERRAAQRGLQPPAGGEHRIAPLLNGEPAGGAGAPQYILAKLMYWCIRLRLQDATS